MTSTIAVQCFINELTSWTPLQEHYCLISSVHYWEDCPHIHLFIHSSHMIFIYSQSFFSYRICLSYDLGKLQFNANAECKEITLQNLIQKKSLIQLIGNNCKLIFSFKIMKKIILSFSGERLLVIEYYFFLSAIFQNLKRCEISS